MQSAGGYCPKIDLQKRETNACANITKLTSSLSVLLLSVHDEIAATTGGCGENVGARQLRIKGPHSTNSQESLHIRGYVRMVLFNSQRALRRSPGDERDIACLKLRRTNFD